MIKKIKSKKGAGFTLIEMLIVALILSILVGAIISVFVSVVRVQRYTLASQLLLDQTSYAMEYMSRSIRMAKEDKTGDCIGAGDNYNETTEPGVMFLNYDKVCQAFSKRTDNNLKENKKEGGSWSGWLPLFSNDFKINKFSVYLSGEEGSPNPESQPRVTISLDIVREKEGVDFKFRPQIRIQTTVSQRDLDI